MIASLLAGFNALFVLQLHDLTKVKKEKTQVHFLKLAENTIQPVNLERIHAIEVIKLNWL